MHTDEYQISLSREIDVCRSAIKKAREILSGLEEKYGMKTEVFISKAARNDNAGNENDFLSWVDSYDALLIWQEKLAQYEKLYSAMKG